MANFLEKLLRTGEGRTLKKLRRYTDAINQLSDEFSEMTDTELREETGRFKERYKDGETLDSLLPEAFATVREASSRTLGLRHFDVQLMGGAALHLGNIAEMKTGEGKTLVATAPAYLNALTGDPVHIITVNDYLATYQSGTDGPRLPFPRHGDRLYPGEHASTCAASSTPRTSPTRTNNEFGFDYLRDNMSWSADELVQRAHALRHRRRGRLDPHRRGPHPAHHLRSAEGDANRWYGEFAKVVKRLKTDRDYEVDEKSGQLASSNPASNASRTTWASATSTTRRTPR